MCERPEGRRSFFEHRRLHADGDEDRGDKGVDVEHHATKSCPIRPAPNGPCPRGTPTARRRRRGSYRRGRRRRRTRLSGSLVREERRMAPQMRKNTPSLKSCPSQPGKMNPADAELLRAPHERRWCVPGWRSQDGLWGLATPPLPSVGPARRRGRFQPRAGCCPCGPCRCHLEMAQVRQAYFVTTCRYMLSV